jgi:hypothetical protein
VKLLFSCWFTILSEMNYTVEGGSWDHCGPSRRLHSPTLYRRVCPVFHPQFVSLVLNIEIRRSGCVSRH